MKDKALINELTAIRAQAQEVVNRATVLIDKAGTTVPASLKNPEIKKVIDKINAKIFNKKAGLR